MSWLVVTLVCLFFMLPAPSGLAATPSSGATIEEEAARADLVVVGRVRSITPAATLGHWQIVSVSVSQVLKGSPVSEILVLASWPTPAPCWRFNTKLVFFILAGSRLSNCDPSIAVFPWVLDQSNGDGAIDLCSTTSFGVLSSDLCNGLPPDRLLALIRAHCGFGVVNQSDMIVGPLGYSDGWPCLLELPIDPSTDQIAMIWARSPDATTRWNAARLLRHTKSPENIAALKWIAATLPDSSKGRLAQAMAADQLRRWSVPLPEPARLPPSVRQAMTLSIFPAALAVFCYFVARRNRGPSLPVLALGRRTVGIAILATLGIFCVSSFFEGFGFENGHCEIAVWRGKLFLIKRSHLEILTAEPGRFADISDLWAVRDYFDPRYEPGLLPWQFAGGLESWGEEVEPRWTTLWGFAIPIWEIFAAVAVTLASFRFVGISRRLVRNRLPGFPVAGQPASVPPIRIGIGIVLPDDAVVGAPPAVRPVGID